MTTSMRDRQWVAEQMLRRIPIDRAQRTLYKLALADPRGRVPVVRAREILGFSSGQFASALAALSKRINATSSVHQLKLGLQLAFRTESDDEGDVLVATDELLDAIRRIPVLCKKLDEPWPAILDGPALVLDDPIDGLRLRSAQNSELHATAVVHALGDERIKAGRYTTRQRWRAAQAAWNDARTRQVALPILFGDASHDSGNLFRWAIISGLEVNDDGTHVEWQNVRQLDGRDVSELVRAKDGAPLSRGVRKLYSVVRTPSFLVDEFARSAYRSRDRGLDDVENDPMEVELVQRRLRRHQSRFRDVLVHAYGGRCAVTGCDVLAVLEAAHIDPHVENGDNTPENGVLLRSDIHALFDEGLLRIDPCALTVHLDETLATSCYAVYEGERLASRADGRHLNPAALMSRWRRDR